MAFLFKLNCRKYILTVIFIFHLQETLRVQIHANCRIRRVYFSDRLYSEEELPAEFKLYLPVQQKQAQQHAGMSVSQHHQQQQIKPEISENALELASGTGEV